MKRFFGVLVATSALLVALSAAPALAGGPILGGGSQDQSVTNSTSQENEAGALNVPVLSGNNVSVLGGGSQSSSTGISQSQENDNTTGQQASQSGSGCGCSDGQDQSVSNRTSQENEASAVNVPIASGNNVSILSSGSQSSSTGVSQQQENENTTKQWVSQRGSESKCPPRPCDGQEQRVSNRTRQENEAYALNVPIASGNNVAVLSKVCQASSTGVWQKQENKNATRQRARQAA